LKKLKPNKVIQCFNRYIKSQNIKIVKSKDELTELFLRLKNEQVLSIPRKWVFIINGFRSNDKLAVLQFHFQPNPSGHLGCEFIYSFSEEDFVEKQCELLYKGQN
jgi:hypothetical protein